jgi:phosphatidylglycerophosphatase C
MPVQDNPVEHAPAVVVFGFDGVLTHADTLALFVRERYAQSPGRRLLAALALPWLLLLWPFTRRLRRPLLHIALVGLNEHRYRAAAEAFAARLVRRSGHFCRGGVRALRRHQAAGDRVIVATACEHALVESLLAQLGLRGVELAASRLRPGLPGMRMALDNTAELPALAACGVTGWQRAYGEARRDLPLLKGAVEPVLVNATPKSCKRAERALGRAIERVEWF